MNEGIELDLHDDMSVEEIMRCIQGYIARHRTRQELDAGLASDFGLQGGLVSGFYERLGRAVQANRNIALAVDIRRSRVPILGPIFNVLRESLHQLVLFYINKSLVMQKAINADLLQALGYLAAEAERQKAAGALLARPGQEPGEIGPHTSESE